MPAYDISAHCKNCGIDHPVLLRIYLPDGPTSKQSVADAFRGRAIPPQVKALYWHTALCFKTGSKFKLEKDDDIFLVPPSLFKRESSSK
jgi:hypothetical protein